VRQHRSTLDGAAWNDTAADWESLSFENEAAFARTTNTPLEQSTVVLTFRKFEMVAESEKQSFEFA